MIVQPSNMRRVARDFPAPEKPAKPLQLHASDAAGQLAGQAAQFAHPLEFNLLALASTTLDKTRRMEAAERLFTVWPALCRLMGELEAACPNASASGYEQAATLREIAERNAA